MSKVRMGKWFFYPEKADHFKGKSQSKDSIEILPEEELFRVARGLWVKHLISNDPEIAKSYHKITKEEAYDWFREQEYTDLPEDIEELEDVLDISDEDNT